MTAFFKNIPKVPILYQVIPICVQLCSVEHKLNTSLTFFSSKLDSPVIKTLESENLILMKNVEEEFNLCSSEQSCIHIGITCYKISTLIIG